MHEDDKTLQDQKDQDQKDQDQKDQDQKDQDQKDQDQTETSLETLIETISGLTKQIEKLEKMNQNLMIQQHVDDVDDSKLFSIFNRYNRKR